MNTFSWNDLARLVNQVSAGAAEMDPMLVAELRRRDPSDKLEWMQYLEDLPEPIPRVDELLEEVVVFSLDDDDSKAAHTYQNDVLDLFDTEGLRLHEREIHVIALAGAHQEVLGALVFGADPNLDCDPDPDPPERIDLFDEDNGYWPPVRWAIAVRDVYRRRGVGRALLEMLHDMRFPAGREMAFVAFPISDTLNPFFEEMGYDVDSGIATRY